MRNVILVLVLVMAVFVVGCAPEVSKTMEVEDEMMEEASLSNGMYQMVFNDFRIMPTSVEILAGDSVEWVNTDNVAYTVVIPNAGVDFYLPPGASAIHRFNERGQFFFSSSIPSYGEREDGERLRGAERDFRELHDSDEFELNGDRGNPRYSGENERLVEGIVLVH